MASSDPPPRRAGEPLIHAELPSPDTKRDYRLYAKQCFHEMLAMCDATNTYRRWTHGMEKGTTTHALRVSTSLEPAVRQNNTIVGTDGLVNVKITTIINAPVTLLFDAMTSPTTKSTTQCLLMGNAVYRRAVKRLTQDRSLEIFETRLGATSVFSSPREFYTLRYIRREMVYELQSSLAYVEASFNVPTVAVEAGHVRAALLLYGWLLSPVNNGVSSEVTHFLRVDLKGWLSASQINGRALELARSNVLALISTSANLTQILSTIEHEQRAASPVRAAQTLSAAFTYVEEPSPVVEESSACSWNDNILSIEGGSIGADELAGLNRDYSSDPSIRVGLDHTSDDYEDDQASYSEIEDSIDETKTPPTMEYEEVSLGSDVGPPGDGNDVDDDDRKLSDHEDDDALFESAKTPEDIGPIQHALTEEEVAATGLERESTGRPRRSSLTKPRTAVLSAASLAIGLTTAVTSATSRRNSRAPPLIRPPDREAVTRPPYATLTPDATPRPKDAEVPRGASPPRTPGARSTSTSRAEEMRAARRDKHASADAPSMQELMKRVSQSQSSTPSLQRTRSAISFARQTSGWGSQGDVGLLDGGKYGRDASGMITPTYRGGAMSLQCSTSSTPLGGVSSSRTMIIDSTSASGFLASLLTIQMRTTPSRTPTPAATPASHPVIPRITLPTNDVTTRPVTPSPRGSASPRTLTTPRTTSSPRSPRTSPRPQLPPMAELESSDDMACKNVPQTSLADDRPTTPPLAPTAMPSTTSPEMEIDDSPLEWKPEKVKLANMVQKRYGTDFMDIMNRQLSPRGAATTITTTTNSDEPTHGPPSTLSFRRPSKPRSRRPSVAVALRARDSDDYSDKTISDMASSPESISATGSLQAEAHVVEELQTCSQTWPIYAEMSATDSLSSNQFDASDSFSYRSDIDSEILKSGSSTDDGEDAYDGTEHCRSSSDSTATASIDTTSLSDHDKNLVYSLWEQHPLVVAAMQGDHGVSVPLSLPPPPSSLPPPPSSLPPPPSSAAPNSCRDH